MKKKKSKQNDKKTCLKIYHGVWEPKYAHHLIRKLKLSQVIHCHGKLIIFSKHNHTKALLN